MGGWVPCFALGLKAILAHPPPVASEEWLAMADVPPDDIPTCEAFLHVISCYDFFSHLENFEDNFGF